jgi:predicted small integral membrane protein
MENPMMFSAEWWQQPLGTWMAWNRVSIAFFLYIFGSIAAMGVWEVFSPGGGPRHGVFGLDTTRGDRLFMTHLGSCFIFLAWLGLYGTPLWGGLVISLIWAFFVFRFV